MRINQNEVKRIVGLTVLFTGVGMITNPVRLYFAETFGDGLFTQFIIAVAIIVVGAYLFDF